MVLLCLHGCFSKVSKNSVSRGPPVIYLEINHLKSTLGLWVENPTIAITQKALFRNFWSSIYSCFLSHILESEFCHLGHLGSNKKFLKRRNFCLSMLLFEVIIYVLKTFLWPHWKAAWYKSFKKSNFDIKSWKKLKK